MVLTPFAGVKSGGIDENEFSILFRRDGEFGFIDGGDAVTDRNPLPVDEDHALGGSEIAVAESSRRVGERGSGKQRGAEHPRVGTDQEAIGMLRLATCQFDKPSGAIDLGKFAAVPARLAAAVTGKQPDLKQF